MLYTEKEVLKAASEAVTDFVSDLEESELSFEDKLETLINAQRVFTMSATIMDLMVNDKTTPKDGTIH